MKIIQYIDTLHLGGSERMAVNIANVLAEDGHRVMLVVSRKSGGLEGFISPKVHVEVLHKRSFWDISAFFKFMRILKEFKPEVVHAHSSSVIWAIFAKAIEANSFQLIFHDHYGMSEKLQKGERKPLRFLSSKIDKAIAVNENLKKWNQENLFVHASKIFYIPNFPYLSFSKDYKKNQDIQIVCLANLRPQKDHLTLLKAFEILCQHNSDANLTLVFAGNALGDSYQKQIEAEIEKLKLKGKVEIKGSIQNVAELLQSSHIGVLSSISEGLPVSLLEYGLAALPVVVTDVGQCAAVVGHGSFGKVVSPQDPEALGQALYDLLIEPDKAKSMGETFKKHVEENYGAGKFLREYYSLIEA